jgi:phosphate transport system substrate-binding protein
MLNAAGYYTEPTAQNVAVSLLKAKINTDATSPDYLTQQLDGVYTDTDPRNYQLSSYSYLILPTSSSFSADKGKTLAFFTHYSLCEGQNESANLGYSPLPVNLVQAGFDQIKKVHVPAGYVQDTDITKCHNPTITTDGSNALANTAPQPQACDKQGSTQCATGTGGAKNKSTALSTPAAGGTPKSSGVAGNNNNPAAPTSNTSTGGNSNTTATTVGPGATSQAACNSDSGGCPAAPISGDSTGGAAQVAAATALLAVPKGWTGTQTLLVVAGLFTFALVLAPGLVLHYLTKRRRP